MSTTTSTISKHKRQGRSAVSNGTRLLEGVDGRSPTARRFRDLVTAYCHDLGTDYEAMTEGHGNTIRQAATAQLQSEALQGAIVRGEVVDTDQLVRLSNLSVRLLKSLGLAGVAGNEDETLDLAGYLANRGQAA